MYHNLVITPYQTVPWQIFLLSDQGKAGCAGAGNCLTGQSSRPRRRPSACSSCWRESTSTLRKQMRSCDGGFAWGDLSPPLASFYSWTMEAHESWLSSEAAEAELPRRCQSSCSIYSRGGTKSWIWKTQVNSIVIPIYKNREKRIFEFGVRLDPPHWPSKFENHHVRVKFQNCRRPIEWPIKTCARRALSLWERFQLNRTYQLGEKSKKPPENTVFQKSSISGGFLDFSPNW